MKTKISETAFTRQVLALAELYGWRRAHFRPARTRHGWRTPVQGDGKGFPDLILLRGPVLIAAELKVGKNRPTAPQRLWLAAFEAAGVRAYVWFPQDWPAIVAILSGESARQPPGAG